MKTRSATTPVVQPIFSDATGGFLAPAADRLSIAGTELDTADRLNARVLDHLAKALLDVIRKVDE